jgi:HAD superfamily hydrolase (TIGR01509 family)
MNKKYILWDNDGVLVNTEFWYFKANQIALSEIDIELTKDSYMHYMQTGASVWNIPKKKGLAEHLIKKQRKKRDALYQTFLTTENIEITGVINTLEILEKDFAMAIITTSKKEDFELIHQQRNILDYMNFYLALGDYKNAKPSPDPYLAGMKKFNAPPEECIVIEDSARGLKSALNANIDCIIIKNEFTKSHNFSGAKKIIDAITNLPKFLIENDRAEL